MCIACPDGKYEVLGDNSCFRNCLDSCKTCSDGTTCDTCKNTSPYISLPSRVCTTCPTGCLTCDSSSCLSCDTGYY